MNRFPLQACLETRWQHTARLLAPSHTAGRASRPEPHGTTIQTRRLHHQVRNTPPRTLASRGTAPRSRAPTSQRTISPFHNTPNKKGYTTSPPSPDIQVVQPTIHHLFDPATSTNQYLIADPHTHHAAIIDPVLDYNPTTRTISTPTADALLSLIHTAHYTVTHILETHAHADHLTAAFYLQRRLAASSQGKGGVGTKPLVGIGKRIGGVQRLFGERYGVERGEYEGVFDLLLGDEEVVGVGGLRVRVVHLPGHTVDHVGFWVGDNVFCGDSLFHPSLGTARCDFPGGSAQALYQSARKLLSLPDHVKIWTGHDYPVEGERPPEPWTSVGEHRARNKHIRDGVTQNEFVAMRSERDSGLAAPRLLHESLQVNIRAGQLPKVDEVGMRTFKLPVKIQEEW